MLFSVKDKLKTCQRRPEESVQDAADSDAARGEEKAKKSPACEGSTAEYP